MLLSDLPDDILGLISFWLNGFDICSLWMASRIQLRQRLVNHILTEFNVEYTNPGRYLWPGNFLKKLKRLSRLSLIVADTVYHLPLINVTIDPIPSLKFFKLHCKNASEIMEQKCSSILRDPMASSSKRYINLNDVYCNLDHFEIKGSYYESDLPIDFLRCLPQNLKSLLMPFHPFALDLDNTLRLDHNNNLLGNLNRNRHFELIPRTLTALDLRFIEHDDQRLDFSKLPPNLTSLFTNAYIGDKTYHTLPQNLEHLKLYGKANNIGKLAPFLPTQLRSLSLVVDDTVPVGNLLCHLEDLESLELNANQWLKQVNLFTKCPAKLKRFAGACLRLPEVISRPFVDGMTVLHICRSKGITIDFIAALPRSVTDLSISHFFTKPPEPFDFFGVLPTGLRSFSTNLSIIENTSKLPESLTFLQLASQKSCEASYFDRFPSKIEFLKVTANLPQTILTQLPLNIRVLDILSHVLVNDSIIPLLPNKLTKLSFSTEDEISDASAGCFPPKLRTLYLENNTKMTDNAIAKLPRTLTHLDLGKNPNFTDRCIKDLPRKLIFVNLSASRQITPESSKDLPQYLHVFEVGREAAAGWQV